MTRPRVRRRLLWAAVIAAVGVPSLSLLPQSAGDLECGSVVAPHDFESERELARLRNLPHDLLGAPGRPAEELEAQISECDDALSASKAGTAGAGVLALLFLAIRGALFPSGSNRVSYPVDDEAPRHRGHDG